MVRSKKARGRQPLSWRRSDMDKTYIEQITNGDVPEEVDSYQRIIAECKALDERAEAQVEKK